MADPIPYVIAENGETAEAPDGAIPIALYGDAEAAAVPNATTSVKGVVNQAAAQADLAGGADLPTVVTAHNALLAKLRTAGILAV